ncbi:MAG TPA: HAMP domain-containing sensor histidine kinase, partial [Candidatus Polarisedimenticolia bacterium]|nr:HAMP domain-containing sensor histidine kinase [Candidatus Polarisedimenticolia bacterium]
PALAIILILLAPAGYSLYAIYQIDAQTNHLKGSDFPATLTAGRMRSLLEEVSALGSMTTGGMNPDLYPKFEQTKADLDAAFQSLVASEPGGASPLHTRLAEAMAAFHDALGRGDEAEIARAKEEARKRMRDLEVHYNDRLRLRISDMAGISSFAAGFTLIALVAGLVVSLIVWVAILLSLGRPLRELVEGTKRVAHGRFEEPIPVLANDELGTLSAAFNRMAASLSELDRMKAEFVASASHELNTPLSCIASFSSLLRSGSRGPLLDEQRATLQQIEDQAIQMKGFVRELLELSRLRAGRVPMDLRSLPTLAFLTTAARGFEGVAERKGIKYSVRIADGLPGRLRIDPSRMSQVVYNLLGNAFKFTEAGGEVTFEAEGDQDWVRVSVSDTGPGIQKEDLPFIFERYFRGRAPDPERKNEGAGLGLAIARGIVEIHGGRIWAENLGGRGSRFIFRIPASGPGRSSHTPINLRVPGS